MTRAMQGVYRDSAPRCPGCELKVGRPGQYCTFCDDEAQGIKGWRAKLGIGLHADLDGDIVETWQPVPGFGGYMASDLGRIKSLTRIVSVTGHAGQYQKTVRGKILRPSTDKNGQLKVLLYRNGNPQCRSVPKLVSMTFLGDASSGQQIRHRNGIKHHNNLRNLHYVDGLSKQDIIDIRIGFKNGASRRELSEKYGRARQTIGDIIRRKTFADV